MFIVAGFPILDSRKFLTDTGRLENPRWPDPVSGSQFVRSFGPIRMRTTPFSAGWLSENRVCDAYKICTLKEKTANLNADGAAVKVTQILNRFYCDGNGLCKFEVGLLARSKQKTFDKQASAELLHQLLDIEVGFRTSEGIKHITLGRAGRFISEHYLNSSTSVSYLKNNKPTKQWVKNLKPVLLVDCKLSEDLDLQGLRGRVATCKANDLNIAITSHEYEHASLSCNIWKVKSLKGAKNDSKRTIRLYLTRLHAEHQCLKHALGLLSSRKILVDEAIDPICNYTKYIEKVLQRLDKNDYKLSVLLSQEKCVSKAYLAFMDFKGDVAELCEQAIEECGHLEARLATTSGMGLTDELKLVLEKFYSKLKISYRDCIIVENNYETISKTTFEKVPSTNPMKGGNRMGDSYRGSVIVHGDNHGTINTTYNELAGQQESTELVALFNELKTIIEKNIPKENGTAEEQQVVEDFKCAAEECGKDKPRLKIVEGYLDGIGEFFKKVDKAAEPVLKIVKGITTVVTALA